MSATESELVRRVDQLERGRRRGRVWLALLTTLVVIGGIAHVFLMPLVMVQNLKSGQHIGLVALGDAAVQTFRNRWNQERIQLGVGSRGEPALFLLGRNERPRLALAVEGKDQPSIKLYDPSNRAGGMILQLSADGQPQIVLTSANSKGSILLGFSREGDTVVRAFDRDGAPIGFESAADAAPPAADALAEPDKID